MGDSKWPEPEMAETNRHFKNVLDNESIALLIKISFSIGKLCNSIVNWNKGFKSMSGSEWPTIFNFIQNLKKDESIARFNTIKCLAGLPPPSRGPKYVERCRKKT